MRYLLLVLVFIPQYVMAQQYHIKSIAPETDASFRGLAVPDDSVVWVSGNKGWVGKSTDGGRDWTFNKVKGYEQCDFRSVYAFNKKSAVIANAGTPAYILLTSDGGNTWHQVYKNEDSAAFIDGIGFWNSKDGIVYGDPIKGKMMILTTHDGGKNWQELTNKQRPMLAKGEASFAASGTTIRCVGKRKVVIATGGKVSRLWTSDDKWEHWTARNTPILQGETTTGIFSIACLNDKPAIIAGGDYKKDTLKKDHIFYATDNGKTWKAPVTPTRGYRECVEFITPTTIIATGPTGTDISYDKGVNWTTLSNEQQYHVVRKSRNGTLVIMAGGGGKIAILTK